MFSKKRLCPEERERPEPGRVANMFSFEAYYPQTTENSSLADSHAEDYEEAVEHFYPQPPVTLLTVKTIQRTFASALTINIFYGSVFKQIIQASTLTSIVA